MLDIEVLEAMVANGATAEMLLAVVKADQNKALARRAARSAAQQRWRERSRNGLIGKPVDQCRHLHLSTSAQPSDSSLDFLSSPVYNGHNLPKKRSLSKKVRKKEERKKEISEEYVEGRRGTRLPADWAPSDQDRAFGLKAGLSPGQIETEADKFRDYWRAKAGSGAVKRDWPATWRNWCRKVMEGLPRANGHHVNGGGAYPRYREGII